MQNITECDIKGVLSQVTGPRSYLGGTPVQGSFPGPWGGGWYSSPGSFSGYWSQVFLGTPSQVRMGCCSPGKVRIGYCTPSQVRMGYLPGQNSRASTFYMAGRMPLAFTAGGLSCFVFAIIV